MVVLFVQCDLTKQWLQSMDCFLTSLKLVLLFHLKTIDLFKSNVYLAISQRRRRRRRWRQ